MDTVNQKTRNPMKWSTTARFWHDVETETMSARSRWGRTKYHLERDNRDKSEWATIISEEIGKLNRSVNKLRIVQDEKIREQWLNEGYSRIITSVSLLRRLAEFWEHEQE